MKDSNERLGQTEDAPSYIFAFIHLYVDFRFSLANLVVIVSRRSPAREDPDVSEDEGRTRGHPGGERGAEEDRADPQEPR